jgi:hypothetical protein
LLLGSSRGLSPVVAGKPTGELPVALTAGGEGGIFCEGCCVEMRSSLIGATQAPVAEGLPLDYTWLAEDEQDLLRTLLDGK